MSEFGSLEKKAEAYAEEHPEQADKGINEVAGIAEGDTDHQHDEQIDRAVDAAEKHIGQARTSKETRTSRGSRAGPLLQRRGRSQEGAAAAAAGARAYLEGGGEDECTLRRNREAFDLLEFLPDMPRDVSHVDTSTTVLDQRIPLPLVLSPIGAPRMFHHEGELAVARAARRAGIPYGISTLATTAVEDVAAQTDTPLWFQLYVWGDRGETKEAIARARAAGFSAPWAPGPSWSPAPTCTGWPPPARPACAIASTSWPMSCA